MTYKLLVFISKIEEKKNHITCSVPATFPALQVCHNQLRLALLIYASAVPALHSVDLYCVEAALSFQELNSSVSVHPAQETPLLVHESFLTALQCLQDCA